MLLVKLAILALFGWGTWWLTGIDKTPAGESKRDHHLTRALRCVGVVFFSMSLLWFMSIPTLMIAPICIAIILRGSLSEIGASWFLRGIDPMLHDHREFDPEAAQRYQDEIAYLIHHNRHDQAIKLCEELKESGAVDPGIIRDTLEFLGVKQEGRAPANPLAEAARLREQQKFTAAESLLRSLLQKNPADDAAAIMLMRVYAQDLRQPQRAYKLLHALEKQPHVPAAHLEFARRSLPEWTAARPGGTGVPPVESGVPPDSARTMENQTTLIVARPERPEKQGRLPFDPVFVDKLLARGRFGSAVETLEQHVQAHPEDFASQLKLAEVHAVHCKDVLRAGKIVQQLERQPGLAPERIALARAKLAGWQAHAETKSMP